MTSETDTHLFSNWAKERLDEIDATLAALQARVDTLQAETKTQAEKTIAEIRAQQQVFQDMLKKQTEEGTANWTNMMRGLESNWASFESLVQKYMNVTWKDGQHLQETFAARAAAQRKAWQEALESLREKANTFAAAHKKEAEEALNQLKAAADTAKARLETQQKAGVESWDALKTALEESRAAFDKATHKVIEAFTKAA
jgi:hypothetical protein